MKRIMLIGNVGRDPEIRADQSGNYFAAFSLGISVGNKQQPKTDWVDIVVNGKLVDTVRVYVKKGSKLFVEGFPTVQAYTANDGKSAAVLKVYVNNLELLNFVESEESVVEEGANNG